MQPAALVYVMLAVPVLIPVTTPVLRFTLARDVLLLLHVPVPAGLLSVVVPLGMHSVAVPVLAPGIAFTVTTAVLAQPKELV